MLPGLVFNASVSEIAARFTMSADDNVGIFALCGTNSTVSPMHSDAFLVTYILQQR